MDAVLSPDRIRRNTSSNGADAQNARVHARAGPTVMVVALTAAEPLHRLQSALTAARPPSISMRNVAPEGGPLSGCPGDCKVRSVQAPPIRSGVSRCATRPGGIGLAGAAVQSCREQGSRKVGQVLESVASERLDNRCHRRSWPRRRNTVERAAFLGQEPGAFECGVARVSSVRTPPETVSALVAPEVWFVRASVELHPHRQHEQVPRGQLLIREAHRLNRDRRHRAGDHGIGALGASGRTGVATAADELGANLLGQRLLDLEERAVVHELADPNRADVVGKERSPSRKGIPASRSGGASTIR